MELDKNTCNEVTYSSLFRDLGKPVYNFIFFKCGNEAQAHDLVQEAFIKLWQNCQKVPPTKAKSYLYTVASNMFLNEVAHKKVILKHAKFQPVNTNFESPEYVLEEKEFSIKVQTAIANLTEGQRTAFLLNRIDGKKYKEVAEILDISVKAVEKRMSQALAILRKDIGNV
jgi:RNA polymerase sigma-70 factor (ECF subfamily)